jgi:hypothetical protein
MKIENVQHCELYSSTTCLVIDYFEKQDLILQLNYSEEKYAIEEKADTSVGIWKIKEIKK